MKKLILPLLLITCALTFAQDKKSLEDRAVKMGNHTINGEFDQMINYTYPKVFTLFPKEALLESFKSMLKGDEFTITIVKAPLNFKFGEIKKIDNAYYSIIHHDLVMDMAFNEPLEDDEIDMMLDILKSAMKTNEVSYTKETKTIRIKKRAEMVAISDEISNHQWTYLNNDGSPLLKKLLPEKAINELGLK